MIVKFRIILNKSNTSLHRRSSESCLEILQEYVYQKFIYLHQEWVRVCVGMCLCNEYADVWMCVNWTIDRDTLLTSIIVIDILVAANMKQVLPEHFIFRPQTFCSIPAHAFSCQNPCDWLGEITKARKMDCYPSEIRRNFPGSITTWSTDVK